MRFISSIFMLLATVCVVISAYFIGHGLIVGGEHTWPWLVAAGLIVAGIAFGFIYLRLAKNDPQPVVHGHGAHVHTHPDGTVHTHPHGEGHHH